MKLYRAVSLFACLFCASVAFASPDPALLLHLDFDDRTAKPVDRAVVPGKTALVGRAGYGPGVRDGSAIFLAGGAFVRVANAKQYVRLRDTLSVAFWVRADAFPRNSRLIQQGNADSCWSVNVNFKGELVWEIVGIPAPGGIYRPTPEPGVWHHFVCIFDRGRLALFQNGRLVGERTAGGATVGGSREPLLIAAGADRDGQPFEAIEAWFDDVRVYTRVLSAQEISELARR